MTVKETIIVCKILDELGYGDYQMTCEAGYDNLGKFPNYIDKDNKYINMEGLYPPDARKNPDIAVIWHRIKAELDEIGQYK